MSCVCNISKLLVDCLQNILLLMQGCSKLLLTCARRGVVVSAKWWFMYKELVEVAQNSLKKQSTRAAGLQNWYESTAREANAKAEAEAEAKRKKEEEEAKQRAEAEAKEKEYQEQVAKRKAEFAEKQRQAREEEVCHSNSCSSRHAMVDAPGLLQSHLSAQEKQTYNPETEKFCSH